MSEDLIVRHCSPTLAGLKTANLFVAEYTSEEALRNDLRALNRVLGPKGLRALPLRRENGRALIYLYRPKRLAQDLKDAQAAALLEPIGYPCGCPERCIAALVRRLKAQSAFPHKSACSWATRRRTCADTLKIARCTANAWAAGRSMAMSNPRGENSPCIKNAPTSTVRACAEERRSTGSP